MKFLLIPLLFIASLVWGLPVRAEPTAVEVIPLQHRTAEQVIPILQPFVDKQGAINGMNNQLIIRTTPSNLRQIRDILRKIDTAPRRLLITVKQNASRDAESNEAEVTGSAGIGDNVRVIVPGSGRERGGSIELGHGEDTARARVYGTHTVEDTADTQQIQVLEGNQAFIRMGKSIPIPDRTVVRNGQTVTVVQGTTYQDVTTGVYVRPRVNGDMVMVEVAPQRNTVGERRQVNIQEANTTVSGHLGEWMEIGGIGQERSDNTSGSFYSNRGMGSDQRRLLIKVEEIK